MFTTSFADAELTSRNDLIIVLFCSCWIEEIYTSNKSSEFFIKLDCEKEKGRKTKEKETENNNLYLNRSHPISDLYFILHTH